MRTVGTIALGHPEPTTGEAGRRSAGGVASVTSSIAAAGSVALHSTGRSAPRWPNKIPLVSYLVLDDGAPHLVAHTCTACGALSPRSAQRLRPMRLASTGFADHAPRRHRRGHVVHHRAAGRAGVKAPFVSATVELDGGGAVTANVVDTEPDPEHISLGMTVKLTTFVVGTDDNGTEAVAFGFAPAA